jgi:hypothetical protein
MSAPPAALLLLPAALKQQPARPLIHAGPSHAVLTRRLRIDLAAVRSANVISVQLIDQENLMRVWNDTHPGGPNIDVAFVQLYGRKVNLPGGVEMMASSLS